MTRDLNHELERRAKRAEKIAELRRAATKITSKDFHNVLMTWVKTMEKMLPRNVFYEVVKTIQPMSREFEYYGAKLENYPCKGLDFEKPEHVGG